MSLQSSQEPDYRESRFPESPPEDIFSSSASIPEST